MIRACQGHSIDVDLNLESKTPPDVLYHGTSDRNFEMIKKTGAISKMSRNHVHLSQDPETAFRVGTRHCGRTFVLAVDSKQMVAEGYVFYLSNNNVWLTNEVPYKYIQVMVV